VPLLPTSAKRWTFLFFLACGLQAGCVTTEEAGGGKTGGPQPTELPIDTTEIRKHAEAVRPEETSDPRATEPVPAAESIRKPARKPTFVSKRDTVVAAIVRRTKNTKHSTRIIRPENPAYTVQIGAFSKASNALLMQKIARERFSGHPVFNNFNPIDRLYRVSVGKFEDRGEAMALRREMMKLYPKEHSECWVNYIAK
jgi:cell division septation protein DedD